MSHDVEEYYTFYCETWRRARKPHVCAACREAIPAGHRYCYVSLHFDGEIEFLKRCARCQVIHKHLQKKGGGDTWPDERLACGHSYQEVHGVPPPPEIAELAFMSPEEIQAGLPAELEGGPLC